MVRLSVILIADFTLDLRRQNSGTNQGNGNTAAASFSMIQFQNVIQHLHQSIIAELGDNKLTATDMAEAESDINVLAGLQSDTEPSA